MNRRSRRAVERGIARDLRARFGCRCTPRITHDRARDPLPDGVLLDVAVTHLDGCPLGDAMRPLNAAGIVATFYGPSPALKACRR